MCHPEVPPGQPEPSVSTREVSIETGAEQMPALRADPDGGSGAPVLVVSDIFGRSPFYENLAGRLAKAGFTALLPEFFFRQGPLAERTREAAPAPLEVADRITGPIIGFWGDQDEGVGMANVERLAEALGERGVDFQHTIYPGLGHGFMSASGLEAGNPGYDAACEAWTRSLGFFREHLS